jgi:peptidoglycan/xylan/chitin deacetylase (PgdA/CDA1 family)
VRVGRPLIIVTAILAILSVLAMVVAPQAQHAIQKLIFSTTFQLFGEIVPRVETDDKVIALTFDDGPAPGYTEEVLKILDDEDVKATFFLTGSEMELYPEGRDRIVAAGHEIGNHSYSHQPMDFVSEDFVRNEVEETDRLIHEAGYEGEILFRPPNGKKLLTLPYYLSKTGRTTVMWDIYPEAYPEIKVDSEKITEYVLDNAKPGSIVLLHTMYDVREETREALQPIVRGLKQDGYRFITVSELLQHRS